MWKHDLLKMNKKNLKAFVGFEPCTLSKINGVFAANE